MLEQSTAQQRLRSRLLGDAQVIYERSTNTLAAEIKSRPPIALAHGDRDDVIPIGGLFATIDGLAAARTPCMWRISPGAGHTIAEDALALGDSFLRSAFAGKFRGWAPAETVRKP